MPQLTVGINKWGFGVLQISEHGFSASTNDFLGLRLPARGSPQIV